MGMSLEIYEMAITRCEMISPGMIERVHKFVEAANQRQKRFSDDLDTMRNRMHGFEASKRQFEYSLREYSQQLRAMSVKSGNLQIESKAMKTNFLSPSKTISAKSSPNSHRSVNYTVSRNGGLSY